MEYMHFTKENQDDLKKHRLLSYEQDHYELSLIIDELKCIGQDYSKQQEKLKGLEDLLKFLYGPDKDKGVTESVKGDVAIPDEV